MVFNGPEPPEDSLGSVTPPKNMQLPIVGMESDEEETNDYNGYQPLQQGPDGFYTAEQDNDTDDEVGVDESSMPTNTVPSIEPADREILSEVWSAPRPHDSIQMDNERAQQVISAMANFVLPTTSIPEWAQSISEEQWKQRLQDKIKTLHDRH